MQLGIVLAPYGQIPGSFPYEIGYSYGNRGDYMCPEDPLHYTRGEAGLYADTQLGAATPEYALVSGMLSTLVSLLPTAKANQGLISKLRTSSSGARTRQLGSSIPSDMALFPSYGFIPHMTGWVNSAQGNAQTSWVPPDGYRASPLPGNGFGCANCNQLGDATSPDVAAVIDVMNKQNAKTFTLTVLTTIAVGVSAVVAVVRNSKAIRAAMF